MSNAPRSSATATPWMTCLVAASALGVFFTPAVADALVYDRAAILTGEVWRVATGHLVHFSASHLTWNLAVLLVAGIWAERLRPVQTRWLLVLAAIGIGSALLLLEPDLIRYAGLSGIAAGLVAYLALIQLRSREDTRWFWRAVLALLALKIIAETIVASPLFAHFSDPAVRSVPLAHALGILCALVIWMSRTVLTTNGHE